jgi:predicted transposase YbfD/YdcC
MKIKLKKSLIIELKKVSDFRVDKHKIEYPLYEILFMTLFGLLKGYVTYKELHGWMQYQEDNELFKKLFGKSKINIPSRSTLHNLLMNTDNNELEKVFRDYFFPYVTLDTISVDGKWLRGSDVSGQYTNESHKSIFNILDKEKKLVVAHKFMEKGKLSEIPAFRELLEDKRFCKGNQIFSFDALLTQVDLLNRVNDTGRRYIAKVKGNQEKLLEKAKETIKLFTQPTDSYKDKRATIEGNKLTKRTVDIFESSDCNLVMFHPDFKNIQTIIRITKEVTNNDTGEIKTTISYLISNFKSNANFFHKSILQHWSVETYHYHLDMLMREDNHIAYVNPFSISILRSFAVNLYQLYFNVHKGEKIMKSKVTMAEIKRTCHHLDDFVSEILEIEV